MHEQSRTNATEPTRGRRYALGTQGTASTTTESHNLNERQSPLISKVRGSTERAVENVSTKVFSLSSEKLSVSPAPANTRNYVGGVVIGYDEISVRCELDVGGKILEAQLPRSLFPENVRYGLPINIAMTEADGLRKPVITIREIDKKNHTKLEEEFNSILNAI